MTRKGDYAIMHTTRRAISHPGGVTESHVWSCVRAFACHRNGGVKLYQESPGRIEVPPDHPSRQELLPIPAYAQPAARRIFEAQTKYETAAELKAALEAQD